MCVHAIVHVFSWCTGTDSDQDSRTQLNKFWKRTFVVVMPAAGVVASHDVTRSVRGQQLVDAVALAPGERATQHLARLVDVELTRAQEAQDVRVERKLQAQIAV